MTVRFCENESARCEAFPVVGHQAFFGHAGVAPLPRVAGDALRQYADEAGKTLQESTWAAQQTKRARQLAGELIAASQHEIALLGPTSLGLNLVAHGLSWQPGDQVIYYADDYPANVYPWMELARQGVEPIAIETDQHLGGQLGAITWERIEPLLTDRTRLVSLATCNFISGYRIDYAAIGRQLHERRILFCLDAIQTVGAFAMDVQHVDFLAADSHKWMLGPDGAGIFYVKRDHVDALRPSLLGSWNVVSPKFIAQRDIAFEAGGRRFEPGMLNHPGIVGMAASMQLLLDVGIDTISARLLDLHEHVLAKARVLGFERYLPDMPDVARTGIITLTHPAADMKALFDALAAADVFVSFRHDRAGTPLIRFSPHFYNTEAEVDRAFDVMAGLV
jgi:cysteine desulfurase/selenocysteine lyase